MSCLCVYVSIFFMFQFHGYVELVILVLLGLSLSLSSCAFSAVCNTIRISSLVGNFKNTGMANHQRLFCDFLCLYILITQLRP